MFLRHYQDIPYEALKYMVAEANYGGRVTDPMDRRAISLILSDFYTPDALKDGYKYSESGKYIIPPDGPISSYIEYIKNEMPTTDLTEVFGLHDNADITSAINETNQLLGTALSLMPRKAGGAGKSQEEILQDMAKSILDKLPANFDVDEASKKHPIMYNESLNTVLQQELLRFNKLINEVRSSLINIGKAIKGEVVMSTDLEKVANSLFDNLIPELWAKQSYPSLKPLASYVMDLIQRLKFMKDWIDNGAPKTFWLSGFYFTQSFLTGIKQNYSRKYVIAIDKIDFDFEVMSDPSKYNIEAGAEDAESDAESHVITTAFEDMNAVLEGLEARFGPAKSTSIIWKPKSSNPVAGDDVATLFKLIDALDDDDDVQNVYGNYDMSDEDLAKYAG